LPDTAINDRYPTSIFRLTVFTISYIKAHLPNFSFYLNFNFLLKMLT
jgi:hypothetical protein